MRQKSKKNLKNGISLMLVLALIIAYLMPSIPVVAASGTTTLTVTFRGDNASYGKVSYSLDDGANWFDITEDISNLNISVTGDNLRLKIVPNSDYAVDYAGIEIKLDDNSIDNISNAGLESETGYSVPSNIQTVSLTQVEFRAEQNNNNNNNQNFEQNVIGKVSVHVTGEELEYDVPWSDDAVTFFFGINDGQIRRMSKDEVNYITENEAIVGLDTKNDIEYGYGYNDEGFVKFNIRTQWDDVITSLKINDVLYDTPQTKEELIEAYDRGGIAFEVNNVPYAEVYNIAVEGKKQSVDDKIMGNFGWTYDENSNEYSDDDKILHGKLELVQAVYNDVTYISADEINSAGGVFAWNDGVRDTDDPTGEAAFPTGTELTLRLIPDAGYQLTSFDLNGFPFEPGEEVGLYTFTIGGGNWHLGAYFSEVGNEGISESANVKSCNLDMDIFADDSFANGTAKLEVNDVASMSPDRMEGFENTVTDEGYEIDNYLDISLYNSIYKGGLKDEHGNYESWDIPVENIEDKATITLELENDMNEKDLIVIHEKHNGNEIIGYEVIDVVYNEESNSISFETDSFSNYAIAYKEAADTTNYTIHFDANGGSAVDDIEVTSGNSVTKPENPTNGDMIFDGWYEDATLTTRFDFNTPITNDVTVYAKWIRDEDTEKYTVTDSDGNIISFEWEKDRQFIFVLADSLLLTDEELEVAGISKEMYNQYLEIIKNSIKDYGSLVALYNIEVYNDENYQIHEGPFDIKIKITDEMKKYDSFKIIFVDVDNGFATESPIALTQEGDYLVGSLEHLSTYVLVGYNTEGTTISENTNIATETTISSNPKTGDAGMGIWVVLMAVSFIGIIGTFIFTRKRNQM